MKKPETQIAMLDVKPSAISKPIATQPRLTEAEAEKIGSYAKQSLSAATLKQYKSYANAFHEWCLSRNATSIPASPLSVAGYVSHLASENRALSTIQQAVSAIGYVHQLNGLPSPTNDGQVRTVLAGIRRSSTKEISGRSPIYPEDIRKVFKKLPVKTVSDLRDRTLLLVGFALALRASEFQYLRIEDVKADGVDLTISILRQKTAKSLADRKIKRIHKGENQETDPVQALKTWLEVLKQSGITEGPLFSAMDRHGNIRQALGAEGVNSLIVELAKAGGLGDGIGGHSLRAGLVSTMRRAGVSYEDIADITDHESLQTLKLYDRRIGGARNPSATKVGL